MMTLIGAAPLNIATFLRIVVDRETIDLSPDARARVARSRSVVERYAAGDAPIYGLNTALGGNLGHRLTPTEMAGFQRNLIEARAVGTGPPLPDETVRAAMLARIVGAAAGASGIAPELLDRLIAVFNAGIVPPVPSIGSIGASDLVLNAHLAQGVLAAPGFEPIVLGPKDGLALINHSSFSVATAARALSHSRMASAIMRQAALLSLVGYAANRSIFDPEINALRPASGQEAMAAWFDAALSENAMPERSIQDALSFRTIPPVMGAAENALRRAIVECEAELNGASDNPAVVGERLLSTPNFQSHSLALSLEAVALAMVGVAQGSSQRMQKLMTPTLSGLPKYLSPVGGGSAGLVPMQKTALALLAEIQHAALPAALAMPSVSETVEDMASFTVQVATKLSRQSAPLRSLAATEAITAAQAIDLRKTPLAGMVESLHAAVRSVSPRLDSDRSMGADIALVADALEAV